MIGTRVSHYMILSELGRGGMGIVYKAQDESLPRLVAFKVLRTEFAQSPDSRSRFLREARTAAVVEHPYIATIFEAGEQDETLFIAMEYVKGVTLRSLCKERQLSLQDCMHHAIEIAEGLARAHRSNVIHRDLKPENIMISEEGHAKILDFGLAKLIEERDQATGSLRDSMPLESTHLTERYTRVGTPAYMSPEQVRAEQVDHRSDIFSFGATLFELLTHKQIFARGNHADTLAAILRDAVPPVSTYNSEAPEELDLILEKCLAKLPRDRYQDTRDLKVDLEHLRKRLESGMLSGPYHPTPEVQRNVRSWDSPTVPIPIDGDAAPSVNPSREPRSPRIWMRLMLIAVILVGGSYLTYELLKADPPGHSIFYERGIHYLREDSESIDGLANAIQMFHRAVAADSNSAVAWAGLSEAYGSRFHHSRAPADLEESERSMAHAISLAPDLPEVLNAEGRNLLTEKRYSEAVAILQHAVEKAPKMDAAWANLGRAHGELRNYAEGLEAIQTAIRLNPQSFRHRISLGNFYQDFNEFESAAASYRRALDLKPNSNIAWNNLGSVLLAADPAAAAEAFRKALAVDDNYGAAWSNLGTAYYYMNDFEAAEKSYRRAMELEPHQVLHYTNLADALAELNKNDERRAVYALASELAREEAKSKPNDAEARLRLGVLCARAHDVECALDASLLAEGIQPGNSQILFRSATIHAILKRTEAALDRLEDAVKFGLKRSEIENDPDLRFLHDQPRYSRIVALAG